MASKRKGLYKLTDGDRAIFARARAERNINYITNFYMRSEDSGTWGRRVTDEDIAALEMPQSVEAALRWKTYYENLLLIWEHLRRPDFFGPDPKDPQDWSRCTEEEYHIRRNQLDRVYRVMWEDSDDPVFHHPHGIQLIDWQLEASRSNHPIQVIVGGMGSSKTWGKAIPMAVRAITLPGYRGFALAPFSIQATEVHKQLLQMIEGTYFERFLLGAPTKPFPHLLFGNDLVGRTTIECYPILDDPGKVLTLTGDEAMVDQAEQIPDLDELIRNVGTRFRGLYRGRPRRGQITLIANSEDNPQLWDWYDESVSDPDYVWAYNPGTYENFYLTVADLKRFEKQAGRTHEERRVHLLGERPVGSGEHFPAESLNKCRARWLDDRMTDALNKGLRGYKRLEAKRVSVYEWEMPPEEGHRYIVVADPGWGDPPERNSAAISVWDITNFPKQPAIMRAFSWVFGGGSPNPWIAKFTEYVLTYKAIGMNGFDSTGFQSGYERLTDLSTLMPTPVSLSGVNKYTYLTLTKKLMADGMFQMPSIVHIFSQCSKYRLPDEKLRQDLVMMLLVTAAMLEPYYYQDTQTDEDDRDYDPDDRWDRAGTGSREEFHER